MARTPARAPMLVLLLLLSLLALHGIAIGRAGVHGDEFALLHMADRTATTGVLEAGGRAGLGVVLLLPFVADCDDEIAVVRHARALWLALTVLYLAGVAAWIVQLSAGSPGRWRDAALGVALLAGVPAFLEHSLEVRNDHLALLGGAWGGALLLASRRRTAWAAPAGLLFGIGLLGSQKVVYVGALAGLLAAGTQLLERDLRPRREAARATLACVGFGLALAAFYLATEAAFQERLAPAPSEAVSREFVAKGFSLFAFYRNTIGWSEYRELALQLVPHALLALALAAATLRARPGARGRLALAWAVLALGAAVVLFHAAAFRYFWLTLGLFPALAFGLARRDLAALASGPGGQPAWHWAGALALLIGIPAAIQMGGMLIDTQAVQRESLAFVHRNFQRSAEGFQPESAHFCQARISPIRTHFSQHIYRRFAGDQREKNVRQMTRTFRETPIQFIVESFRLNQFPVELRRFWADNYQPYHASVFVAGRRLEGRRGSEQRFELLVPGRYRWLPRGEPHPVAIGDRVLAPGEVVELGPGEYRARFVEDVPDGMLVLAMDTPPSRAPLAFYQ